MATKLDLADAQFIGFNHGKWNRGDIVGLVQGMGLSKKEWLKWKREYSTHPLTDEEIREIDEHFNHTKKLTRYDRQRIDCRVYGMGVA